MRIKISFLVIACNLMFFSVFSQNSWYVSKTGNDTSGDGSQIAPWATITKALSEGTTVNGDTIHILGTITNKSNLPESGIGILKDVIINGVSKKISIVRANENSSSATS